MKQVPHSRGPTCLSTMKPTLAGPTPRLPTLPFRNTCSTRHTQLRSLPCSPEQGTCEAINSRWTQEGCRLECRHAESEQASAVPDHAELLP